MPRYLIAMTAAALAACSAGMQPNSDSNEAPMPSVAGANLIARSPTDIPAAAPVEPAAAVKEPTMQAKRNTNPSCDIIVQPTSRGIRLKAVARFGEPVSGRYSMVVTKRGRAGSSDVTQGGPFKSGDNAVTSLSSAELSVEDAAHYQAVLTLHVDGRQVCRREVRS